MKIATQFTSILVVISVCVAACARDATDESIILEKKLILNSRLYTIQVTQNPFVQTIQLDGRSITNAGTMLELHKQAGRSTGNDSSVVVWRKFIVSTPGPTPSWSADIIETDSTNELVLALSSGTSIGFYQIKADSLPNDVPSVVTGSLDSVRIKSAESNDRLVLPPELARQLSAVRKIVLISKSDGFAASIQSAGSKKSMSLNYSRTRNTWSAE